MIEAADTAVSWLGDLVLRFFSPIIGFFLQFFPDADQGIIDNIHAWGNAMTGYDLTFNYFYFVDVGFVSAFFNIAVTVIAAFILYVFVKTVIEVVQGLVEMIPFVE